MKKESIYLAGPMDAVKDKSDMCAWRDQAKDFLAENYSSLNVLDPVRRPHSSECTLTDKEIVELDLADVEKARLLLVDCRDLGIPVYGTPIEVFYCNRILGKPTIGWYDKEHGYRENSVFQNVFITNMFPSLEEALEHIVDFYY